MCVLQLYLKTPTQVYSFEYCEIFKNAYFEEQQVHASEQLLCLIYFYKPKRIICLFPTRWMDFVFLYTDNSCYKFYFLMTSCLQIFFRVLLLYHIYCQPNKT